MKKEFFVSLMNHRFKRCAEVMDQRSAEYSRNEDRLHHFKRASSVLASGKYVCEPEGALAGEWIKPIVSVLDMIDDLPDLPNLSMMREKITDCINYLVLLEALFMERIDPENDLEKGNTDNSSSQESAPYVGPCMTERDYEEIFNSVEERANKSQRERLKKMGLL